MGLEINDVILLEALVEESDAAVLPKKDLSKLTKEFTQEPYATLWRKMASNEPWSFEKTDIPYCEDKEFIR